MHEDRNGPFIFIGTLILLVIAASLFLIYGLITQREWSVSHDPAETARQWATDNHDQVTDQLAAWAVRTDPRFQNLN